MPYLRTRPVIPSHVKDHLIRILGISKNPSTQKYVIMMQFANNGNLRNYLKKNYSIITWDRKLLILQYIAGGLKSLHALGLIHKNLHSNNILLHEEIPLIGDFGLCRPVDKFDEKEEIYGVLPYVAPEVLRTKVYTKESDIYSFAFIMWEMCTYLPPLCERSHDTNLVLEIFHGLRPKILEGTPRTFARFMKLCWDTNPSKRPTAEEVYNTLKYWQMEFSQKRPTECYTDFKAADDWKKKKLLNNPNIPCTNHHPNAYYKSRPLQLPDAIINDFTSNLNSHLENFARGEKVFTVKHFV
ncbi:8758_t:CDS:2 [Funneliformis geosporum]|uniref:14471_t:CDS:1 n=1 Tax=Funneliformis geosporum TaxID=1117311 RepID=A0A9W4WJF5_9GLOM|nr:14471_t:CDS:2 [Funneliformis geosporum]CAI2166608.1 8758_t:CDS:2 [Funneliformis geosporum]